MGEIMDSASLYKSLDEPDRADHLWRYTPWRRVHPSGDLNEIPIAAPPKLTLSCLDDSEALVGISVEEGFVVAEEFSNYLVLQKTFSISDLGLLIQLIL